MRRLVWIPIILTLALALPLLLSGCGSLGDVYDALFTRGAQFYDQALQSAVDIKCKASSAGAVQRRYMKTSAAWKLWTDECLSEGGRTIPGTSAEKPLGSPSDD